MQQTPNQTQTDQTSERQFKGRAAISNVLVVDGRLESVAVITEALEFRYSHSVRDNAVSLLISRIFDDYHRRTVEAYVHPDVAQHLIVAFSTVRTIADNPQELWKYLFDVADIMINNLRDFVYVRIGGDYGLTAVFGYQYKSDGQYNVFATVEWKEDKYTCTVHESDLVPREEVNLLKHYLENVLSLVRLCMP